MEECVSNDNHLDKSLSKAEPVFSLWSLKLMSRLSVKKISNSLMHFFVLANLVRKDSKVIN
jgi:hypothetical protein